ncbi:MAG TPA: methionyl-tRNA formyltransferase [Mycobacteriales bacterium]|nr:methionyl-tRNA formyltransferase [Mycobacteriales bacterium]
MRVVFAGTPEPAVPSLEALLASGHEVLAVLTRPDAPAGRGRALRPSPVREVAEAHGVEVLTPALPREEVFQQRLAELAPDVVPVVAYGALVPRPALDIPRLGWVNLHFSLLPAWRGAAPVQHALLAGDEVTGATTFLLEEGLDTGPFFGMLTEQVRPTDTAGDLLGRLAVAGAGLLVATLDGLADGSVHAVPQPAEGVSLAPKITVADARVDWATPALRVDRVVRACTPAPGAWSTFRDARVKLGPVTRTDEVLPPGVLAGDLVGTATQAVRLGRVRPEGKGEMAAADWLRGLRPEPGEAFA